MCEVEITVKFTPMIYWKIVWGNKYILITVYDLKKMLNKRSFYLYYDYYLQNDYFYLNSETTH